MAFFGLTTNKKRKKEQKKAKALQGELNRVRQEEGPDLNTMRQQAKTHAEEMHQTEQKGREEGRKRQEEFFGRNFEGLTAKDRARHESDAARRINREIASHRKEIIGKRGHHGMRGGSAYAQEADLARLGHEAHNEARSAIQGMDRDLALKKQAAAFAVEEGGASGRLMNEQAALDELKLENERKKQNKYLHRWNLIRG